MTVFVDTSDAYADCWDPFFTLLAEYWPEGRPRVVLNTNHERYEGAADVEVHSTRNSAGTPRDRRLPWGTCLRRGLEQVDTPYVLYLLEDYFLHAPVRLDLLERLFVAVAHHRINVLRLLEPGNAGPWLPTRNPDIWRVDPTSEYLVSLQAGIWRRDLLAGAARAHEGPWQFEIFGTRRLRRRGVPVHTVNRVEYGPSAEPPIPYVPTGVVKGRWDKDVVVDLFAAHGIDVDYDVRGFHTPGNGPPPTAGLLRRAAERVRSEL